MLHNHWQVERENQVRPEPLNACHKNWEALPHAPDDKGKQKAEDLIQRQKANNWKQENYSATLRNKKYVKRQAVKKMKLYH